jgi:DNA-binding transcriptional LysR family regulator
VQEPSEKERLRSDEGFDEVYLADDPYRVVLPLAHPLAHRRELTLADLAAERFTAPPAGGFQPYRMLLERLCADAGFEPIVAYEVNDVTVARAFVAAGLGVAVLPDLALPPPHEDVAIRPLREIQPFRAIYATRLRDRRVPAVAEMVRYLGDAARARLG